MTPKKLILGGREYLIGGLDLFQSLNLSRLAAPLLPVIFHEVLSKMALEFLESKNVQDATPADRIEELGKLIYMSQPILEKLAEMDEQDFKKIIVLGLSAVERRDGQSFCPVVVDGNVVYSDIGQQAVITLVLHVLARELRPTIGALLGIDGDAPEDQQG